MRAGIATDAGSHGDFHWRFCRLLRPLGVVLLLTGWVGGVIRSQAWSQEKGEAPNRAWPLIQWAAEPSVAVFEGREGDAWDLKIRERGWILKDGPTFHLWYTGYNDQISPTRFLGHATSNDGVSWTRTSDDPIFTGAWVEDMTVVKQDDIFYMFAEGRGDIAHLLTSRDGVDWEEVGALDVRSADGTPIAPGPFGTPCVWVESGVWYLFYERGDQGVWLATSRDRTVWTNVQDEPVLAMGPTLYDQTAVAMNQIVRIGDIYYASYHANAERPWANWTSCIARSKDLIHWEKYSGNPIVCDNRSSGLFVEIEPGQWALYTMHPDVRRFIQPQSHP